MDVSEEVRAVHKRELLAFLENDVGRMYMDDIKTMINHKRRRLIVDISDLHSFRDLAPRILRNPGEYMQAFSDAATDLVYRIDGKYLKEGETVLVGFEGPFVSRRVTPRELLSEFIGSMVCVEGIVTKCSLVRSKVVKGVHFCPSTEKFTTREYGDITSNTGLPTASVYPTRDENGNLLVTESGLCQYKDHQTISMQEMPENSAPGQLPQTVDVIVQDDLVDSCKPGDRVAIVGIYKAIPGKSKSGVNAAFRTVLIANNVSLLNKEANASIPTPEDLKNIKKIAGRDDACDLLGNSLAPSSNRGPKRRRVGCSFITNESAREVTFSKRRQGLFRKATELSILCGAEIVVITYSPHGNPFAFAHPFTPDALIHRYLSDGATGSVTTEAAAHRKQFEDTAVKLQDAKSETKKIAAEASRKRSRWWEEAVRDDMEEDELEYYIASLERLIKLVSDRVSIFSDSGFYIQLLATDMKASMDMDAMFLDELEYS